MSIDTSNLGVVSAELMDFLGELGGGKAVLGEVLVLAEVEVTDDDGDSYTNLIWRCSDNRSWIQTGLMQAAIDAEKENRAVGAEED